MTAVAWTAIGLLASTLAVLTARILQLGGRIEALGRDLGARIDAQGAYLGARIDALGLRLDAHLQRHWG